MYRVFHSHFLAIFMSTIRVCDNGPIVREYCQHFRFRFRFDIVCQVIEQHIVCTINVRRLPLRQLVVSDMGAT